MARDRNVLDSVGATVRATMALALCSLGSAPRTSSAQAMYSLSSTPVARFGESSGAAVQLSRIAAAMRLADGSVIVADALSSELHHFADNGRYRGRVARAGAGPNELQGVQSLWRTPQGFVVRGDQRLTTFSNAPVREIARRALPSFRATVQVTGVLGNGVLFGTRGAAFRVLTEPPNGVTRDTMRIALLRGEDLADVVPVADRPGNSSLAILDASKPGGFRSRAYRQGYALHWAAGDNTLWLGDSESGDLLRISDAGARLDSLGAPFPPRAWSASTVRRLARAATDPLDAAEWDAKWLPSTPPRFAGLYADPGGGVWVEEFREDPIEPRELRLVQPKGSIAARMTVPGGVHVLEIGRDYLLGVRTDADDVPEVQMYRLNRR